ncbi:glycosyltransferase [Pedobacter sp. SYSU D00535]|uniref:glycosyltransferase family 2 protein n=1 Tax=Pedobacter sp. SYSU D00535 TaxID=2810308 RepID=UPI001A9675D8|nr:glycosyltransferase [Pedobacter sp. SYSU D00535]
MVKFSYPNVSLLITHYNRSASLHRLLTAFQRLGFEFGEIVVSDDGSNKAHLSRICAMQERFQFKLVTTPVNLGLGNNLNKGQDAVTKPFTLYVQEDFIPFEAFRDEFPNALQFMQKDADLDIIRFYAYFRYPYTRPYGKGFSEMIFKLNLWYIDHLKFYFYSDHPHLRRSNFFQKFGRYPEGLKGDLTEFSMCLSFVKHGAKGLFYDKFRDLFDQVNYDEEPSTMRRSRWKQQNTFPIFVLRALYQKYRLVKNTVQFLLLK